MLVKRVKEDNWQLVASDSVNAERLVLTSRWLNVTSLSLGIVQQSQLSDPAPHRRGCPDSPLVDRHDHATNAL